MDDHTTAPSAAGDTLKMAVTTAGLGDERKRVSQSANFGSAPRVSHPVRICRAHGGAFIHMGRGRPPINCGVCAPEAHERRDFIARAIKHRRYKGAFMGELRRSVA